MLAEPFHFSYDRFSSPVLGLVLQVSRHFAVWNSSVYLPGFCYKRTVISEGRFLMDFTSESDDFDSDSEVKENQEEFLKKLREGKLLIKNSDGTLRCPFCTGKKKQNYRYKELLQHAIGLGAGRRDPKATGAHRGLEKYLKTDLADAAEPAVPRTLHLEQDTPRKPCSSELVVWPWMGVLMNISTKKGTDGRYWGAGSSEIKDRFSGFNPVHVHVLWNHKGHLGEAVIEFRKDWLGYNDACLFENSFVVKRCSWRDYDDSRPGKELYGWMARAKDYNSLGLIGKHLRAKGNLKTVTQIDEEEKRKKDKLVDDLHQTIQQKDQQVIKLECQVKVTEDARQRAEEEKNRLEEVHREEMKKFEDYKSRILDRQEHQMRQIAMDLAKQKAELKSRREELDRREAQTELEKKKLEEEKKNVYDKQEDLEKFNELQRQQEDNYRMLVEKHQQENKELSIQLHHERKKLAEKQKLELEIQEIQTHIHMTQKENVENSDVKKLKDLEEMLEEKSEELEGLEDMNKHLLAKERTINDELQNARKKIIEILAEDDINCTGTICIKRMGEMAVKPWKEACKKRYGRDWEIQCTEIFSKWEDNTRDSAWYPFKVLTIGNKHENVINEDDEKLKELRDTLGKEVCDSVIDALKELNEYNASGRYPVPEIWNSTLNRRATLSEAYEFIRKSKPKPTKRRRGNL